MPSHDIAPASKSAAPDASKFDDVKLTRAVSSGVERGFHTAEVRGSIPLPPTIPCKYGDPLCPCQDGDMCHYEGPNPMAAPQPLGVPRSGGEQIPRQGPRSTQQNLQPEASPQEGT